jgi:hypothetical protein
MLTAPPSFTQVSVPSTLTKPGPYAAQELLVPARFPGSSLPEFADLSGFWLLPDGPASAAEAGSTAMTMARRVFRIPPFIAEELLLLLNELDADGHSATPDHLAVSSGPGVARERQPQSGGQRVGIVNRDLRARGGHILHQALARGEAAFEGDPSGLLQGFARFPLLGYGGHFFFAFFL